VVLTVQRGSVTIANPHKGREITSGDVLLCFGKSLTLQGLAPAPKKKKAKTKSDASSATAKPTSAR
jgi:uncharacterized protein with PhoU and TrkA domain